MNYAVPLFAAALMLSAAPGWAQSEPEHGLIVRTVRVSLGGLDLSSDAGADALLARLNHAAAKACGRRPTSGVYLSALTKSYRDCKASSLTQAVADVGSPMVTQRYAQRANALGVRLAEVGR